MAGITYDLSVNGTDPDRYYREVAVFTDQVLAQGETWAGQPIADFQRFHTEKGKASGDAAESLLELLILGTFWRIYGAAACAAPRLRRLCLTALSGLRQRHDWFKSGADHWRGMLLPSFLATGFPAPDDPAQIPPPTLANFKKLVSWLAATGEFSQEIKRFRLWQDYLINQPPAAVAGLLGQAVQWAAWFESRSQRALGPFTGKVENFLAEQLPRHRFQEDYFLCGRRRVEYHLNMVGAEILNRAFRAAFLARGRKALILPSCMRLHTGTECRANQGCLGLECRGCSVGCRVNQLTRIGFENHFEVYVIPHESSMLAQGVARPGRKADLAVIGVACALKLLAGGWKLQELGIPSQCVLLNCCGCKKHWLDRDTVPDLNVNQLLRVLKNWNYRSEDDARNPEIGTFTPGSAIRQRRG